MRRILFPASVLAVLALLVVPQVIAHRPTGGSALDEQTFKFRGRDASTSSRNWRNVPGFRFRVCAVREVSGTSTSSFEALRPRSGSGSTAATS